jgi:uncharacterized protein with HEPN domain
MPKSSASDRARHILDAIAGIERLTRNKTLAAYQADPDLAAAVERYLERLSEASRHIPDALKGRHPGIDWKGIADLGNVLRHVYDHVLDRRIWQIVETDLEPLRAAIADIAAELDRQKGPGNGA